MNLLYIHDLDYLRGSSKHSYLSYIRLKTFSNSIIKMLMQVEIIHPVSSTVHQLGQWLSWRFPGLAFSGSGN